MVLDGQPPVQGAVADPPVDQRFHIRLDVAGLCLGRIRHRCLYQAHCQLAREQLDAD